MLTCACPVDTQVIALMPTGQCLNDLRVSKPARRQTPQREDKDQALAPLLVARTPQVRAAFQPTGLINVQLTCMSMTAVCRPAVRQRSFQFSHRWHAMQELLDGFNSNGIVYLDLECYPTDAFTNAGAGSCIAGELRLMPGMFGMPSQVRCEVLQRFMSCCPTTRPPVKCLALHAASQSVPNASQIVFTVPATRAIQLAHFNEEIDAYELLAEPLPLDASQLTVMLPMHTATNMIRLDLRGHCLN